MKRLFAIIVSQVYYALALHYYDAPIPNWVPVFTDETEMRRAKYEKYMSKSISIHNRYVKTHWVDQAARESYNGFLVRAMNKSDTSA